MDAQDLPFVDEHATSIAAGADDVWAALTTTLDAAFAKPGAAAYARLVRCRPSASTGPRPLVVGSAIPGFSVTSAIPRSELVLEGRHLFSTYALVLRLESADGGTRLRAETRAAFPGLRGRAYRLLVIGSRGHVLGMRGLLAGVRRRAEAAADQPAD